MIVRRPRELAELDSALRRTAPSSLAVWGEPGIGKSTLVRAWCEAERGRYLVEADALVDPFEVASRLHAQLSEEAGEEVEALMRRAGAGVVVIDNADEVLEALEALVAHWHEQASSWRVIVVARARARWCDHDLHVEALDEAQARALLAALAPDSSHDAIVALLDGNPLALEMAARRLAVMSERTLVARLARHQRILQGDSARHRSWEASFALSWQMLPDEARRLFGRALAFVGYFSAEDAEAVLADDDLDALAVLDGLQLLLEHGLLRRRAAGAGPQLSIARSFRHLARARCEADDLQAAARRHAAYYATQVEAIIADPGGRAASLREAMHAASSYADHEPALARLLSWLLRSRAATTSWGAGAFGALGSAPSERDMSVALLKAYLEAGATQAAARQSEVVWRAEMARGDSRRAAKASWRGAQLWHALGQRDDAGRCLDRLEAIALDVSSDARAQRMMHRAALMRLSLIEDMDEVWTRAQAMLVRFKRQGAQKDELEALYARLGDAASGRRDFARAQELYALSPHAPLRRHDAYWMAGMFPEADALLSAAQGPGAQLRLAARALVDGQLEEVLALEAAALEGAAADLSLVLVELARGLVDTDTPLESLATLEAMSHHGESRSRQAAQAACALLRGEPLELEAPFHADELASSMVSEAIKRASRDWEGAATLRALRDAARREACLMVARDGARFILPDGALVELSRRKVLARLVVALAEQRSRAPGVALAPREVFEAVWPEEPATEEASALNRVRVAVRRLRSSGLGRFVETSTEGYRLDPSVELTWLPAPS